MTSLLPYNTFGINANARAVEHYVTADDVVGLLTKHSGEDILPVGAGSNLLFTRDFDGIVLVSADKTVTVETPDKADVSIRCGAGVVWDEFVEFCVKNGYQGVENLSLIPGTCGASAVQNIGAYGAEAKDVIIEVEAVDRRTLKSEILPVSELQYGYRTSRFKTEWADRYIIVGVRYRLVNLALVDGKGVLNLNYRGLREAFDNQKKLFPERDDLTLARRAVISVRQGKLPDVKVLGSAGSFFMNPAVSKQAAQTLLAQYPDMPHFDNPDGTVKIPAAWLIEQAGWKGRREGNAGVYEKQPLVLVNFGGATGQEVAALARKIQNGVAEKFAITLHTEVIYI